MADSTSSTDDTCTSKTPSEDDDPHHAARHTSVADEGDDDRNTPNDEVSSSSLASRSPPPSRILFGSCNSQYHEQPLWPNIISRNAAAFVWCGDAVYADDRISPSKQESQIAEEEAGEEEGIATNATSEPDTAGWYFAALPSINQFVTVMKYVLTERQKVVKLDATPEYLSKLLKEQKMVPGYQELLQTNISIFGTIDDVSDFVGLLLLL